MQKASHPPQDRTMVVACLAEVAQNMGSPIAGYVDVILLIFFLNFFIFFIFYILFPFCDLIDNDVIDM